MFGSHATSPRPSPPTPVGGEGESCAVFLKNPRRDWPEVHPQNRNRPQVISSWQSATQAHGLSAPEARQIVAHGETVGLVVNLIQAPDGATENQPTDIFFRPSRGLIRLVRLTRGSRRGLLSAVAPRLRTLRVLRATKPHPLFNPVRPWSGIPVFRQPRQGRNLCSHASQPFPSSVRSEIFRPQPNPNMSPQTGLYLFQYLFSTNMSRLTALPKLKSPPRCRGGRGSFLHSLRSSAHDGDGQAPVAELVVAALGADLHLIGRAGSWFEIGWRHPGCFLGFMRLKRRLLVKKWRF